MKYGARSKKLFYRQYLFSTFNNMKVNLEPILLSMKTQKKYSFRASNTLYSHNSKYFFFTMLLNSTIKSDNKI